MICRGQDGPPLSAYRDYALANNGNPARGKDIFSSEQRGACAKCHSTDGSSRLAGPDLFAIADKFPKAELIRHVLEPSAAIAIGYGTTVVERRSGEEVQGIIKQASDTALELMGADAQRITIPTSDIRRQRTSNVSLMPEGLQMGMSLAEFSDLIAYLETLRQPTNAVAGSAMPEPIPRSVGGARFTRFFRENIRLTRPVWFGLIPGSTNAYVVLEHGGKSWLVERGAESDTQTTFLDLTGEVRVGGPRVCWAWCFIPASWRTGSIT